MTTKAAATTTRPTSRPRRINTAASAIDTIADTPMPAASPNRRQPA